MQRKGALVLLAFLLAAPLALGQQEAAAQASFLVYHAPGGRDPDPLATPLAPGPDAARLPATFFDRAERASNAPENQPQSAPAHYREMERVLSARERAGAALSLGLDGALLGDALRIRANTSAPIDVELVVFEHGVPVAGRPQPYVARFATEPARVDASVEQTIALDPTWARGRLGVVAIARVDGEVAQSATWIVSQTAPTRQTARGVLVEHVTASWCDACTPADEAFALLASQRGAAGPLSAGEISYFRAPGALLYVGLAFGALAALALTRRPSA